MKQNEAFRIGVLVFCVVLCIFYLTFTGVSSTDDEQLYAALTASLAERGAYNALSLVGNDRIQGNSGGVEPLHPLLGVPFYLLAKALNLGKVQFLHLLPSIYTALTACIISVISIRRGFDQNTSFLAGLAFALCTIAFPFGRTYFREPLATLLTATAFLFLQKMDEDRTGWKKQSFYLSCMLFLLVLSGLVKLPLLLMIPFFLLGALRILEAKSESSPLLLLISFFSFTVVSLGSFFLLNSLLPSACLRRFSASFINYLLRTVPKLPHDHFLQAFVGMLFSPGKGLFLYSPILLMIFLSSPKKKRSSDMIIAFGVLVGLASAQALIYNEYWWTITWSSRSLLPAIPLLIILCLPALEQAVHAQNKKVRFFGTAGIFLGFLIQVGRILVSDPVYAHWAVETLGSELSSESQWIITLMPLWRHWWLLWNQTDIDIAWFRLINPNYIILAGFLFVTFAVFGFSTFLTIKKNQVGNTLLISILIVSIFLAPLVIVTSRNDARYFRSIEAYQNANRILCDQLNENDLLLVDAYLKPTWWYFSNFGCGEFQWIGLPYEHTDAFTGTLFYPRMEELSQILDDAFSAGRDVYLMEYAYPNIPLYHKILGEYGIKNTQLVEIENPTANIIHLSRIK